MAITVHGLSSAAPKCGFTHCLCNQSSWKSFICAFKWSCCLKWQKLQVVEPLQLNDALLNLLGPLLLHLPWKISIDTLWRFPDTLCHWTWAPLWLPNSLNYHIATLLPFQGKNNCCECFPWPQGSYQRLADRNDIKIGENHAKMAEECFKSTCAGLCSLSGEKLGFWACGRRTKRFENGPFYSKHKMPSKLCKIVKIGRLEDTVQNTKSQ